MKGQYHEPLYEMPLDSEARMLGVMVVDNAMKSLKRALDALKGA